MRVFGIVRPTWEGAISETPRACLVFSALSSLPSTLLPSTRAYTMSTKSTTRSLAQLTATVSASLTLGGTMEYDEGWWKMFSPVFVRLAILPMPVTR
jgi:hypothetical protein